MIHKIVLYRVLSNFIKSIGVNKVNVIRLMKKSLAALLLAFVLGAMLPACSSTEEDDSSSADSSEQEASGGDNSKCPEGSDRDYPECMPF